MANTKTAPLFAGARLAALNSVAELSFGEAESRSASLTNMRKVLGNSPSGEQVKAARTQWVIGRVASRLPVSAMPKGKRDKAHRLAFASDLVLHYAAPPKPGTKAAPLRASHKGRRSAEQQRVVRAAETAATLFFSELGLANGETQQVKNAKARKAPGAPSMAGSGKGKAKAATGTPPAHAELVKPAAPVSSDDYVNHVQMTLASLVQYDNKHARKRPTTHAAFAEALMALRTLANKAANDYQVRKLEAEAKAGKTDKA